MKRLLFLLFILFSSVTDASQDSIHRHPPKKMWSFSGPMGKFDMKSINRGFEVFHGVCAACHSINRVAFRDLEKIGFTPEQVKTFAATFSVIDGPNDLGEMFERPGKQFDKLPAPYPNDLAAAAANNGAVPPDLSLITKARHNGPDYLYAILTGYTDPPAGFELPEGGHFNPYMEGGSIAMPPPLFDSMITYSDDGSEPDIHQMAHDVVNFLQWAAEPEMEKRKNIGIKTLAFLLVVTVLLYMIYKKTWEELKVRK